MFNKFNPFGNDKNTPYVVPPPAMTTPYYNNYYGAQQFQAPVGVVAQPAAPAAAAVVEPATPLVPQAVPANTSAPVMEKPTTDAATANGGRSAVESLQEPVLASATRG